MVRWLQIGQIRRNVEAFLQDQRGSVLAILGFGLVMATGFTALAVDMGHLYVLKGKLQTTADFAVLAAMAQLPDENSARTTALEYAAKNMPTSGHGNVLLDADVATGNWDTNTRTFTAGGNPVNAVQVITRRAQANGNAAQTFFARVLGFQSVDITTRAIAARGTRLNCVIALSPTIKHAIKINNGTLQVNNCSVHANSGDNSGIFVALGSTLRVTNSGEMSVYGGYGGNGTYDPDVPQTGIPIVSDPLAGLAEPSIGPCDYPATVTLPGGNHTVDPGVYCKGLDLTMADTVTFTPGLYIFHGGGLLVGNQTVIGDGVTFYFSDHFKSLLSFKNDGSVDLSAPITDADGGIPGVLFFGSRSASSNTTHRVQGKSTLKLEGTIYFPRGAFQIMGNSVIETAPYTLIIADTLRFSGQGTFNIGFDTTSSGVPLPAGLSGQSRTDQLVQ